MVLLAPAASSFDQYDNFERRGEDFAEQVMRYKTFKKRHLLNVTLLTSTVIFKQTNTSIF